jgi:hypothetical protein
VKKPAMDEEDGMPKFGHLVQGAKDGEEADGEDGEEDGDDAEEPGKYDLKSCANDIMSAVQSGDVEALEMALEELLEKRED